MLNPQTLERNCEQYEQFQTPIRSRTRMYQYDFRDADGELFSTVKPTLDACREARDKWLAAKEGEKLPLENA